MRLNIPQLTAGSLLLMATSLPPGCGADVESYTPTLAGIDNEGLDSGGAPQDISFAEGQYVVRTADDACPDESAANFQGIADEVFVSNQYRTRTVRVVDVGRSCAEATITTLSPGQTELLTTQTAHILRIYDEPGNELLSAWVVPGFPPLDPDRIILRDTQR